MWTQESRFKEVQKTLSMQGSSVGSTLFYMSRCRVYSSRCGGWIKTAPRPMPPVQCPTPPPHLSARLYREQFAVTFADQGNANSRSGGGPKLLLLSVSGFGSADSILRIRFCGFDSADSILRIPLCGFDDADSIMRNGSADSIMRNGSADSVPTLRGPTVSTQNGALR